MHEKRYEYLATHAYYFSLSYQPGPTLTLTRQMEAVIVEVCTVQVLRLRADPRQLHEMQPMVKQDFTLTKLTCRLHFCPIS